MTVSSSIPRTHRVLIVVALAAFACLALAARPQGAAAAATVSWSPCNVAFGPFECATVRVPLDYDRPGGERIDIALTRLPATDPGHRIGSLFLNPGGPGGSGVDFVLGIGQSLYTPEVRARFDLVGFDPRGIVRSSGLRCFGTPKQWGPAGTPFAFPMTPGEETVRARADRYLVDACQRRGTRVLDHISTANVARDLDVLRRAVGDDKLSYAGFSYGSYLGVTYANMFPDRVRAVVVDGVLDPVAWSTGRGNEALTVPFSTRLNSHLGAQRTLDEFFRLCDAAGEGCAFSGGAAARFAALADRARQAPLKLVFPDGVTEELGYSDLISITLGAMYSSTVWAEFAQLLADIEASSSPATAGARLRAFMTKYGPSLYPNFVEGGAAIACEDTDNPENYAAWSVAGAQADETSFFGRAWTWLSSTCAAWTAFDADRYMGPFNTPTASPLLVVNPRFDPATRYESAVTVDDLMPDSALLTVNGWGHTSIFMSQCADTTVERYLVDGVTPPAGATCDQDVAPFAAAAASGSTARKRVQALSYANGQSARSPRHTTAIGWRTASRVTDASWSGLSRSAIDALGAQVAADDRGNAVYAWSSSDPASPVARVRMRTRSENGRLGPIVDLSDAASDAFDVHVAVNASGAAVFSWVQFDPAAGSLAVKTRSRSARGVLGPVADVSVPGTDAFEHQVAISDAGNAVITWTAADPAASHLRANVRSRSAAGVLGPVAELGDPALDSFASHAAIDPVGGAVLVWTQGDPATWRTRVQTRTRSAAGALGPVADVSDVTRNAGDATVAVDDRGGAVFEWLAFDDVNMRAAVRTRSRSASAALGPIAELSDAADDAWDPVVAVGDDGAAVFSWWVVRRTGARVEARSRSARGLIGQRVVLSDGADDGYEPQVSVNGRGAAMFTWLAFNRDGVRVQARSRTSRGVLGPRMDLSRPAQDAFSAQVDVDEDGAAMFGWSALDGPGYQVLGRSLLQNGMLGSPAIISSTDRRTFDAQLSRTAKRLDGVAERR